VNSEPARLTLSEKARLIVQAGIIGIPVIGPSLEKLCFGGVEELRLRRVEATLREIGEALERDGKRHKIDDNEDFAGILESVLPRLGRATSEGRRAAFRKLLLNATQLAPGDLKWTEAELAVRMLDSVNEVGLSLIAALHCLLDETRHTRFSIFLIQDDQYILSGKHADEIRPDLDFDGKTYPMARFDYHDSVARFWVEELERLKLITCKSYEAVEIVGVSLTHRAGLLIEWALADGIRRWY
jgi:hypothetical protein